MPKLQSILLPLLLFVAPNLLYGDFRYACYEAVTGSTPSVPFAIPAPGMPAAAEVLMHDRSLKLTQSLMSAKGRMLDFGVSMTYRSNSGDGQSLGQGWTASFDESFTKAGSDKYLYTGADGRQDFFAVDGGSLIPPAGFPWIVKLLDEGRTILVNRPDGSASIFAANPGSSILSLRKTIDRFGNKILYMRDAAGRLSNVIDDMGRMWTFQFVEQVAGGCHLAAVTDFDGLSYTYSYDNGKLTGVTGSNGSACHTGSDQVR